MKTADERAGIFVNMHTLTSGMSEDNKRIMVNAVSLLLKEQDKITRHACADNVSNMEIDHFSDNKSFIDKHKAAHEIINTKAV